MVLMRSISMHDLGLILLPLWCVSLLLVDLICWWLFKGEYFDGDR